MRPDISEGWWLPKHRQRDFRTHNMLFTFLKNIDERTKDIMNKLFSITSKGSFSTRFKAEDNINTMNIKTLRKELNIPQSVKPWFTNSKQKIVRFFNFAIAYNNYISGAELLGDSSIISET